MNFLKDIYDLLHFGLIFQNQINGYLKINFKKLRVGEHLIKIYSKLFYLIKMFRIHTFLCCILLFILYSNTHLFDFEQLNQNGNTFEKECITMQTNFIYMNYYKLNSFLKNKMFIRSYKK